MPCHGSVQTGLGISKQTNKQHKRIIQYRWIRNVVELSQLRNYSVRTGDLRASNRKAVHCTCMCPSTRNIFAYATWQHYCRMSRCKWLIVRTIWVSSCGHKRRSRQVIRVNSPASRAGLAIMLLLNRQNQFTHVASFPHFLDVMTKKKPRTHIQLNCTHKIEMLSLSLPLATGMRWCRNALLAVVN